MQEKQSEITLEEIEKLEFISETKDATGREFRGYYNKNNQNYHLVYVNKDGIIDFISKHTADIKGDLYDPFVDIKGIHGN